MNVPGMVAMYPRIPIRAAPIWLWIFIFTIVNDLIKKDIGVENYLYAVREAGATLLGDGHMYWMKDIVGDKDELQEGFDAMSEMEQSYANHLQILTSDLMFYLCWIGDFKDDAIEGCGTLPRE